MVNITWAESLFFRKVYLSITEIIAFCILKFSISYLKIVHFLRYMYGSNVFLHLYFNVFINIQNFNCISK